MLYVPIVKTMLPRLANLVSFSAPSMYFPFPMSTKADVPNTLMPAPNRPRPFGGGNPPPFPLWLGLDELKHRIIGWKEIRDDGEEDRSNVWY
mmetsp:Transcript_27811/g.41173  ORF Transcript_27811/g.41173 Transcript_27811/m.41173 type:complete len:92 (-) Transcript_27811:367-642(-)